MLKWIWILYSLVLSVALARAGHRSRWAAAGGSAPTSGSTPTAGPPAPAGSSRPRPTRILIIGATGGTGRQLVAQALDQGYEVTALARDPARLQVRHPRLTVVKGDVLEPARVEAAMRGQQAVLSALGHKRWYHPTRIQSDGMRNILQAMRTHRVPRLVCETALGLGDSAGRLGIFHTLFIIPLILPFYFWDKTRQERLIAASDIEWVIVRPGVLTDGARRGARRHGPRAGGYVLPPLIARADVADFMLQQLTSDTYLRMAPGVSG